MNARNTHHDTFTIERMYEASPAQVFKAWSDPAAKKSCFACDEGWESLGFELDFRIGGRETNKGRLKSGGPVHAYDAHYQDIVPNERIIYSYDMHLGDKRISVSLTTVELKPAGSGTRLIFTEQGVFLDGYDNTGDRKRGTESLLDALGKAVRGYAG